MWKYKNNIPISELNEIELIRIDHKEFTLFF